MVKITVNKKRTQDQKRQRVLNSLFFTVNKGVENRRFSQGHFWESATLLTI